MKKFIKLIALSVISTLSLSVLPTTFASFSDVTDKTDYKTSIEWMQKNEIINGYGDGTFKPDKCVSRAEFLKMFFKVLEINVGESKADLFSDTPADAWYAPYVRTARELKTIKGYEDGKFRPDQCVNRAEAIKMATVNVMDIEGAEKISKFKWKFGPLEGMPADAKDSTLWFYPYLEFALKINVVGKKHINADKAGELGPLYYEFFPNQPMSRKEVAEMLYRIKAVNDNDTAYYYDEEMVDFYEQEDEPYEFYKPNTMVFGKAEVNFEINQILLTSNADAQISENKTSPQHTLEFDVYLERTDLKLKENIKYDDPMPLTVDLPLPLQPKLMYLSTVDDKGPNTGSMCDRPRFPHRCTIIVVGDELKKTEHKLLLKLTFEDDTYVAKEITVPHPKALDKPEISLPKDVPGQSDKFDVEFKDVGADEYDVGVSLCKEYGDDGINPCLDGTKYHLTRNKDSNTFVVTFSGDKSATVEVKDGLIRVKSDVTLTFEESLTYDVTATSKGKTTTGIATIIKNSATKFFSSEKVEGI